MKALRIALLWLAFIGPALAQTVGNPGSSSSGGAGTVTSVSVVSANGVAGSVANPTTTPAITLTCAGGTCAPIASPTFTGIVTMPDSGTWNSSGINSSVIGGTTPAAGTFTALAGTSETLTGGTLAGGAQVLNITATQPATPGTAQNAVVVTITGAGSASNINRAFQVNYNAGYTGSSLNNAASFNNTNAGTGSTLVPAAGNVTITGNLAANSTTSGTTTGLNIGTGGVASNGNLNVGLIGLAQILKNSATNIGVAGSAINTGTSPVQIGGWFSLNQTVIPTVSAALIADNASQSNPVALFRCAGVTCASVDVSGNINTSGRVTLGSTTLAVGQAGDLGQIKETDTAAAPGAGFAVLKWVAGTNANTCKLIGYAGTSATPTTIVDNVGTGC